MNEVGVGLVGYRFMGRAHSNAYRQVARFFDTDPVPRMRVLCGRDEEAVRAAADSLGWDDYETDYARMLERDDVGLVDISSSGDTHHEFALAALEAGMHVLCEKPLANTLSEARDLVEAAERSGTVSMVCHNYRRVPAVQPAKRLIDEERLGKIRNWRAIYLQDWLLDPEAPMSWRLRKEIGGAGPLADLGSHLIDLAHFLVGPITEVTRTGETFVKERPLEGTDGANPEMGQVTVNDSAAFVVRFDRGAIGTLETSPMIPGRKAKESFEINGSEGSIVFDLERMNELQVYFEDEPSEAFGFRTVLVTEPEHPYMEGWWPPGHIIGYEHTFVHTVKDLLVGIKTGNRPGPTFEDGYRCQAVLDAVERSLVDRGWITPEIETTKGEQMENSEQIGVGVIGVGGMGGQHATNLHSRTNGAYVVAVMDADGERLKQMSAECGDAKAFDDGMELIREESVEAVVIASPDSTHAEFMLECIRCDKPVLCEKPLCATLEEAQEIVDAEVDHGRKLVQVGFMRRYDPQHVAVAREATDGEIGRPLMFKGINRAPEGPTDWDSEFLIRNAMVHDLDSARWMLGQEIEEVYVRGVNNSTDLGEDTWDLQSAQLGMSGGCMASIKVFVTASYGYEVNADLVCERGIAQTPLPHDAVVRSVSNRSQRIPQGFLGRFSAVYEIEVEQWINALRRGAEPEGPDAWDGYISLVATEGCAKSLNTGSPQRLEKPERPKMYSA